MVFPGPGALALVLWIGAYALVSGWLLIALSPRLRSRARAHQSPALTTRRTPLHDGPACEPERPGAEWQDMESRCARGDHCPETQTNGGDHAPPLDDRLDDAGSGARRSACCWTSRC